MKGYNTLIELTNDFKLLRIARKVDPGRHSTDTITNLLKKRINLNISNASKKFKDIIKKNNYTKDDLIFIEGKYMEQVDDFAAPVEEVDRRQGFVGALLLVTCRLGGLAVGLEALDRDLSGAKPLLERLPGGLDPFLGTGAGLGLADEIAFGLIEGIRLRGIRVLEGRVRVQPGSNLGPVRRFFG